MIKIGDFELVSVVNGTIRLDGGAMFGVVPKALWQNICDVDDENRIPLATRTLLAVNRKEKRVFLVDTGCGTKWAPDKAARYAIEYDAQAIPKALDKLGLTIEAVTDVVISHLHFDHNGGLTEWVDDPDGPTQLRYANARHWVHREHWQHARRPHIKDRASFLPADFDALDDAGVLGFVEGDGQVDGPLAGLSWLVTHGHTPWQLHPVFSGCDGGLVFAGDIIPTVAHLRVGWVMAYDVEPLATIAEKERMCRQAIEEKCMLAFPHDPKVGAVLIDGEAQRPIVSCAIDI